MKNSTNSHLPVNWIDGMKISKNHFIQTDNSTIEKVNNVYHFLLNDFSYGLLPGKKTLEIAFNDSHTELSIQVNHCIAITPGGARIYIESPKQLDSLSFSKEHNSLKESTDYFIVLSVNPFDRMPSGIPNAEENPPRHPFGQSKCNLSLLVEEQINPDDFHFQLIIGRVNKTGQEYRLVTTFIPPCCRLDSHPLIISHYDSFGATLVKMNATSLKIITKIFEKSRPSPIAQNFKALCEALLNFNADNIFKYRNILPVQAPVYLIEYFSNMGNTISNKLSVVPSIEREELLKYFYEWCDIKPGDFEEAISNVSRLKYNHHSVYNHLQAIDKLLKDLDLIWTKMDSLEFIGQRKENMVVTKEVVVPQSEPVKKRWSILD